MLVRPIHDRFHLLRQGKPQACIVTPSAKPWLTAATRLANEFKHLVGEPLAILDAGAVFDRDQLSLTATSKSRPLIFIGHAGVNSALLELYARRIFVVDDVQPGSATIQTFGNPWGNGQGVALVGASCEKQIDQAVERFIQQCQNHLHAGDLSLPRLCDPGPDTLVLAANQRYWHRLLGPQGEPWCAPLLDAAVAHLGYEETRQMHEFTVITDVGVFDAKQVNQLEQAMLTAVLQMPAKVWWYPGPHPRNGRIGGRHENFKAPRLLLLVRHLLQVGRPDEQARLALEHIQKPLEQYLDDVLTCAYRNDHEGAEATSGWEAMTWAALALGKSCYFTSGRAKEAAFHAFLETDNLGASASHCQFGGVENLFQASELRLNLGAAAWWYEDDRYRWLLQHLPYVRYTTYSFPLRLESQEHAANRPDAWLGMQWQPVSEHSYESSAANARWRQPAMAREQTFDVLSFRSGFAADDQYLAIDGFQNHFQPLGLGTILRYVDLGKLFLVAHTGAEGNYYKSGLAVSRGVVEEDTTSKATNDSADTSEPWGAELVIAIDAEDVALSALRCADYHDVDWTRNVIWRKGQYFLLMDHVTTRSPGLFALTATWRTGFPAHMNRDNWVQQQGDVSFHLKPSRHMASHAGQESAHLYQNEVVPYVLRQHVNLQATQAGDQKSIANLIYATSPSSPKAYEIASLTDDAVVIRSSDHTALAGRVSYEDQAIVVRSPLFHISDDAAVLAGPAELWLHGRNLLKDMPAGDVHFTWQASDANQIREVLGRLWDKANRTRAVQHSRNDQGIDHKLLPHWEATPFTGHHQQIATVLQKDVQDDELSRWVADFGSEQQLHEVIVECEAQKLVGGDFWPEFNTQPAHAEPVTLQPALAQAARLKMIDQQGTEQVTQGRLIHRYIGPYNKSCYTNQTCIAFHGGTARRVAIELPQGISLKSVIVNSSALEPASMIDMQMCDPVASDGQTNLMCRTADDQLALISDTGKVLWQRTFERKILAAAALKMNLQGPREIVVSDAGANLWRIAQDGRVLECTTLSTYDDPQGDFFNQGHTQNRPYSLGTWTPQGQSEPSLFMGTYQSMAWRHANRRITCWPDRTGGQVGRVGIGWRGLIYWDRTLRDAVDLNGDGVDDQVVLGRGFATSPSVMFISGKTHKVFAEHPFPNGWTLGLERVTLVNRQVIIAANEFQLGIYALDGSVLRTLRFDTPAAGYATDGEGLYVAKRDGMLLRFDGQGRLVAKITLHGPLLSIAAGQTIVVAGQDQLHLLSRELVNLNSVSMRCSQLLRICDGKVAAATGDGRVVMLPIN